MIDRRHLSMLHPPCHSTFLVQSSTTSSPLSVASCKISLPFPLPVPLLFPLPLLLAAGMSRALHPLKGPVFIVRSGSILASVSKKFTHSDLPM